MSDPLAPYDAVLVVSYGGPDQPDDVLPFMRNATRGRGIPDERLVEVSGHYMLFGGRSPINERNAELLASLSAELQRRGSRVPLTIGNRNWHPYIAETLRELAAAGARRVLMLTTAAYASYSGCRQYREDVARALEETGLTGTIEVDKVGPYAETDGFVTAGVDAVREAVAASEPGAKVLFVTHSIPLSMDASSGSTGPEGRYSSQHRRVAERLASEVGVEDWEIAYCSRSGAPHIPWLEPDVNDRTEELAADGVTDVVTVPFGFINDHMEVIYDLDTQARETAERLGLGYRRAATVGVHPAFVGMLADLLVERAAAARGDAAPPPDAHYVCAAGCCAGRPGPDGPLPAVCGASETG